MTTIERHRVLIDAFKEFHENNGVFSVSIEILLESHGYSPDIIREEFDFDMVPAEIIRREEVMDGNS